MNLVQKNHGYFTHLRVCRRGTAQLQEVSPFPNVGGHNNLSFKAVRKNGTSFLRCSTTFEHIQILPFSHSTQVVPEVEQIIVFVPEAGLDNGNLRTKSFFTVIAVASGFLAVCRQPVPNDFVGNATITNKLDREGAMFQNSFMSTLDDTSYKLSGTGVCNIGFGLVANPSALLKPFQAVSELHHRQWE